MLAVGAMVLAGCGAEPAPDICRDPYTRHVDEPGAVARLSLDFDAVGNVRGRFQPPTTLSRDSLAMLTPSGALFVAGETGRCASSVDVAEDGASLAFDMNCADADVIKTLNVTAFDSLPGLEEMVVVVTTPATSKTFAILRACPGPLFRL